MRLRPPNHAMMGGSPGLPGPMSPPPPMGAVPGVATPGGAASPLPAPPGQPPPPPMGAPPMGATAGGQPPPGAPGAHLEAPMNPAAFQRAFLIRELLGGQSQMADPNDPSGGMPPGFNAPKPFAPPGPPTQRRRQSFSER